MDSEYGYVITEKALCDIEETIRYLSEALSNPQAAKAFFSEIEESIKQIVSFPQSGSPVINPYLKRNDIRNVKVKNYLLYYRPDFEQRTVYILRVVYSRRNMTGILHQLNQ